MEDKKKVPRLRFPGFTDDWKQRKLGDLMDVGSVKRVHQTDWRDSGVRFLRARDVVADFNNEEPDDYLYIDQKMYEEYSAQSGKVQQGDLLVTGVGTIGIPMLIKSEKPLYFKDGNIIWFKNKNAIDGQFFYYSFISKGIQDFIKESAGIGTVGTYTIDSGKKTPINLPTSIEEQQEIGIYFKTLDNLITLHQRQLDNLKNLKKGCLQKMFPRYGETKPELRFPGFTDDWEQRKVSEIANRYDNLRVPVAASERVPGSTPYYGANGIQDYVDGYTHEGEFVLIAEDGANDLKNYPVQYTTGKIWVNNHAHVLQGKEKITDNKFLGYSINATNIESLLVGGGRAKLNAEVLMGIELLMPSYLEQCRISEFLFNLDNLITLHQRELDELNQFKKGMLQQMFV